MSGPRVLALLACVAFAACSAPTPPPSAPAATASPVAPAAHAVDVLVIGPDATAVEGADVCAASPGREDTCAASGSDGHASLRVLPGVYWLRAAPPPGTRLAEGVAVVDLRDAGRATVTLPGRATVSGTVRDTGGTGIAGASVCAHATTSEEVACERTRPGGTYAIEVRPGIHKVEVTPPVGTRFMHAWATGETGSAWNGGQTGSDVALAIDTRTRDVAGLDVILRSGVTLSGTVTAAAGARPVEEAQVCTYPFRAPLGWDCGRTDKKGRYTVLREPDDYWIWVIPPGERGSRLMYQRYDRVLNGFEATPFDLHADARLDVGLTEGVVLRGTVSTTDGAPVALALVCLDTPFPTGRICRQTAGNGSYEIATRPETYVVSVIPPQDSDLIGGYWPNVAPDWTKAGEVRVGSAGAELDIALPHGVRLSGTVRDGRGVPLEGTTLNVNDASGPRYSASTDLRGHYTVNVAPGSYTVDVFAPLGAPALSLMGQPIDASVPVVYDVVVPDLPAEVSGEVSGP